MAQRTSYLTLRQHVELLPWPEGKPAFISLEDWTKAPLVAQPPLEEVSDQAELVPTPSRDELMLLASSTYAPTLLRIRESLSLTLAEWKELDQFIGKQLGKEAPSLPRVAETLGLNEHAISSLLSKRPEPSSAYNLAKQVQSDQVMSTDQIEAVPIDSLENSKKVLSEN